ncbi:SPRY domain [seawater metagenome]|uniref:SPRY domain n=1 Tax=seawater metagenome TaxID=1561972 RepID=A0A5E8CGU3_9ZZZZ
MEFFPNDVLNHIFENLDYKHLNICCQVCEKWNFLINYIHWKKILVKKLHSFSIIPLDVNNIITYDKDSYKTLYCYTLPLPTYFITLDYTLFDGLHNFNNNQFELNQKIEIYNNTIYFTGNHEGGDRIIISNKPVPTLLHNFVFKNEGKYNLKLSNIFYFEIEISNSAHRSSWSNECISIGFGTKLYPLVGSQLGWAYNSVGFHSDDGKYYNNSGHGKNYDQPWGAGDTIGCGLIKNKGNYVFYTKNGKFLGFKKFIFQKESILYAMLGVDSSYPIEFNFNSKKFKFNIINFINDFTTINKINLKKQYNKIKYLNNHEDEDIFYDEDSFAQAFVDILNLTINM